MRHVLWDWNGTLLDDTQAALDALNIMLARRGLNPVTMEFYRANFSFPVRPFYARIGLTVADRDWDALAREYHETYDRQPRALNVNAIAALERVKAVGAKQSILSALRQDLLDCETARLGVAPYMTHVCGTGNLDGASKLDRARELMMCVGSDDLVLIGDALHDKEVADDLGIACVLCSQGGHASDRLRAVAPTAPTLLDALSLAGI